MSQDVLASLAVQLPLVAAVIWVVMALLKDFRTASQQQQQEMQRFAGEQQKDLQAFIDGQNIRWQDTLAAERDRRRDAMNQGLREVQMLAGSIDKLATALTVQNETIARHDAAAKERHDALLRAIAESKANA